MTKKSCFSILASAAALAVSAAAVYVVAVRPWHQRWGTRDGEPEQALPGDEDVLFPKIQSTRAIDIAAPPEHIWPWLVQMGQGRGGFYSYDWLENLTFNLGIHNANQILPEYQALAVGDTIRTDPAGGFTVAEIEAPRSLVLRARIGMNGQHHPVDGPLPAGVFDCTWAFHVVEESRGQSRLLVRFKLGYISGTAEWLFANVLLDPVVFIMETGMLRGIKKRAETFVPYQQRTRKN